MMRWFDSFHRLSATINRHLIPEISYFGSMRFNENSTVHKSIGRGGSCIGGNSSYYRPVGVDEKSCEVSSHHIDGGGDNRNWISRKKGDGCSYRDIHSQSKSNCRMKWRPLSKSNRRMKWRPLSNSESSKSEKIEQCTNSVEVAGPQPKHREDSSGRFTNYDVEFPPMGSSGNVNNKRRTCVDLGLGVHTYSCTGNGSSSKLESSSLATDLSEHYVSSLPTQFGKNRSTKLNGKRKFGYVERSEKANPSESFPKVKPFDICLRRNSRMKKVNYSLPKNGEMQNETDHTVRGSTSTILRPGMVLLKHFITLSEQVYIVKTCQQLGLGPGGFYQPGYKDGAKLRLQMMCLGRNWEPETRKYNDCRSYDGCEPPCIPHEFSMLVKKSMKDAHDLIKKDSEVSNVEEILPGMSPDICIVNFYTTTGRLGLHQDRDESRQSLSEGLPVVSFSLGDSAEFLYGDQRRIDEADNILLESGDVLIFGGNSRHVFHGVSAIIPETAPEVLLSETMLRPGRLNLTFRQF